MRRLFVPLLLALPLAVALGASPLGAAAADATVDDLLREVRKALGGEKAVAKVAPIVRITRLPGSPVGEKVSVRT